MDPVTTSPTMSGYFEPPVQRTLRPGEHWDEGLTALEASRKAKELGINGNGMSAGQMVYSFPIEEAPLRMKVYQELFPLIQDGNSRAILNKVLLPQAPQQVIQPNYVSTNPD